VRRATAASAAAAVAVHVWALYGISVERPATPLPPAERPIVVGLVATAPPPSPAPPAPAAEPLSPPPPAARVPETPRRVPKPKIAPSSAPTPAVAAPVEPTPSGDGAPATTAAVAPAPGPPHAEPSAVPRYRNTPEPEYPAAARRAHQEGVVVLAVEVDATGRPTAVSVRKSSGFPLLDEAARDGVQRWRFDPARSAGVPIASRVEVPVRFSLAR
jgi:protein TonB